MVLGIAGVFLWVLGIPQLLAIIFGHVSLGQISRAEGRQKGRGQAIAGLCLGYLELIGFVIFIIAAISSSSNSTY